MDMTTTLQTSTAVVNDASDHDALLSLLFESIPPESQQLIESQSWAVDYLSRLTDMSLDALYREPSFLDEHQSKIKSELVELAFREYPAFIYANESRTEIQSELEGLTDHLEGFQHTIPILETAAKSFSAEATRITSDHAKIQRVLDHHEALLDTLEIPQLMDTCVRNGYYAETLNLSAHVGRLVLRYPNIPLIHQIATQVDESRQLMLAQLLGLLQNPIKLPQAMNVIGFLRRMEAFSTETELRTVFLKCRDAHLVYSLVAVADRNPPTRDPFEYLKKYIDVSREHFFEIITQYWSIFSNVASTPSQEPDLILPSYTTHLLTTLLNTLSVHLPSITDTSALASLLTQLMYCGISLGRIGLDFRSLIHTHFEDAVYGVVHRILEGGMQDFVALVRDAAQNHTPPSQWMTSHTRTTTTPAPPSLNSGTKTQPQPPLHLLDHPPLAQLTNAMILTLNSLRLLAPIELLSPLRKEMEDVFSTTATEIAQYADGWITWAASESVTISKSSDLRKKKAPDIDLERLIIQGFVTAYVRSLIPFLRRGLTEGIFGATMAIEGEGQNTVEDILQGWILPISAAVEKIEAWGKSKEVEDGGNIDGGDTSKEVNDEKVDAEDTKEENVKESKETENDEKKDETERNVENVTEI